MGCGRVRRGPCLAGNFEYAVDEDGWWQRVRQRVIQRHCFRGSTVLVQFIPNRTHRQVSLYSVTTRTSTALSWCNTMSLIVTIFFLVFLTELVSWIGKSVLVEFVCRLFACLEVQP